MAGYSDERGAVMLGFLRHGHADDVAEPFAGYLRTWQRYLVDLLGRGVDAGELRADLDRDATAVVIMEFTLGLQTRAPLVDGQAASAVDQLLALLAA